MDISIRNYHRGGVTSTSHYNDEAHIRRDQLIRQNGGYGKPICAVFYGKGHRNGPEKHILTDNAIIIVQNLMTKRIITTKFARPGQIRELNGKRDMLNGNRPFDAYAVPRSVYARAEFYQRNGMNNW